MDNRGHEPFLVLLQGGEGEIIEKRSRFIATVGKAESEEEANLFVERVKKKYWDARHNCHAYIIGSNAELTRCSDDGEPAGTAGRPMLEVLAGSGIRNAVVVVTRYFGGTLLGTGGLVRAYSQAVQAGLGACSTGVMRYGCMLGIETDYSNAGKLRYILEQAGIEPADSAYTDTVHIKVTVPEERYPGLSASMVEATNGRAHIEVLGRAYYIDKECSFL